MFDGDNLDATDAIYTYEARRSAMPLKRNRGFLRSVKLDMTFT